jgi:ABC-2 type transport system ATP-binding protein
MLPWIPASIKGRYCRKRLNILNLLSEKAPNYFFNIRKAIKQINQEEQTTILLTTHDLNDIELLCDRIFMIDRGQEIFDGSVSQLKQRFGKMHEVRFEMTQQLEVERLDYHQHFSDLPAPLAPMKPKI